LGRCLLRIEVGEGVDVLSEAVVAKECLSAAALYVETVIRDASCDRGGVPTLTSFIASRKFRSIADGDLNGCSFG
jgi:hypothetical protein